MKKVLETSKGKWKVVEINTYQEGQYYVDTIGSFHYKLSEITEEEASYIIGASELILDFNNGKPKYLKRLESLYCILKSQGIEITNNTYIFKV